jgi:hypothetical protein
VRYLYHRVGLTPPSPDSYYNRCRGPLDAFDCPDALSDLTVPQAINTAPATAVTDED